MSQIWRSPLRSGRRTRSNATVLSEISDSRLRIACVGCRRSGSYAVARLIDDRGDICLSKLVDEIAAECQGRSAVDPDAGCRVRFVI
jgi:hypothetical protein